MHSSRHTSVDSRLRGVAVNHFTRDRDGNTIAPHARCLSETVWCFKPFRKSFSTYCKRDFCPLKEKLKVAHKSWP